MGLFFCRELLLSWVRNIHTVIFEISFLETYAVIKKLDDNLLFKMSMNSCLSKFDIFFKNMIKVKDERRHK